MKGLAFKIGRFDNQPYKAGEGVFEWGLNALVFINQSLWQAFIKLKIGNSWLKGWL